MRVYLSNWSKYLLLAVVLTGNLPKAKAQNVYDLQTIREVRVKIEDPHWAKKLKALKEREPDRRIICSVNIDGVQYDSAGIRYKGNSSYNNPSKKEQRKLPINIKLDHVRAGRSLPGGIATLKLSNAFRDPSYVREPLAYEIARNYMPASGSNFVRVYINDEYMGAYNNTESIDKAFLIKHFGNEGKALFKCDPDDWQAFTQKNGCKLSKDASLTNLGAGVECYSDLYEITGSKKHYADLIKLIQTLEKSPEKVHEILDLDQTLWMLAFNNLFVNLDSYNGNLSHNYYLFLDSLGQFRPILWDMNLAFGGFRFNGKALYTTKELIEYSPMAEAENPNRPLISLLLKGDYNRKLYYHHMRTMLEDWVESKRYFTSATQMQSTLDKSVLDDKNKLYTYEAFKENLKATADAGKTESVGISELMEGRAFYLRGLAEFRAPAPKVKKQSRTIVDGNKALFFMSAEDATDVVLMYRSDKSKLFKSARMSAPELTPDQMNMVDEAGMIERVIKLPLAEAAEYYYVIEGDQSTATFPARASREYLK
jgi:CotH kinase protein